MVQAWSCTSFSLWLCHDLCFPSLHTAGNLRLRVAQPSYSRPGHRIQWWLKASATDRAYYICNLWANAQGKRNEACKWLCSCATSVQHFSPTGSNHSDCPFWMTHGVQELIISPSTRSPSARRMMPHCCWQLASVHFFSLTKGPKNI